MNVSKICLIIKDLLNALMAMLKLIKTIFKEKRKIKNQNQVALLRGGWNELMIAGFSHRSTGIPNGKNNSQR